jgi:hypothetical protein
MAGYPRSSARAIISRHLESPGTRAYSTEEIYSLLKSIGFREISLRTALGPSDLMLIELGQKYQSIPYRMAQALYPRWLIPLLGEKLGFLLMIHAIKPQ